MKRKISKFFNSLKKAPERKHYLEFITAALSIPVLLTVILVNVNNLNAGKKDAAVTPPPTAEPREIIIREGSNSTEKTVPTNAVCKKDIGPISISYPKEGATLTDNPVNFIIKHDDAYCTVVWSYRINGGSWSEYSSNAPSVYNLPSGAIKFELRIQSTVSNDQDSIERNFIYQGASVSTPTSTSAPTPTAAP